MQITVKQHEDGIREVASINTQDDLLGFVASFGCVALVVRDGQVFAEPIPYSEEMNVTLQTPTRL